MRHYLHIFMTLIACWALGACQWNVSPDGKTGRAGEVKVHRFDRLMEEYVKSNSFSTLQKLNTEYPQEVRFLIEDVLSIGSVHEEDIHQRLREYYTDSLLQQLRHDALLKFEDMSGIERQFNRAFRRMKHELPQMAVPKVYAQISALGQSVVVGDSILGFSIDKYMGADYPLYEHFYYDYQRRSMSPERIVPECLRFYLLSEYPFPWEWHRTLLDHILHQGKIHWVVSQLMKTSTLEEEMGYTVREGSWCAARQDSIWNCLVQSGQLHSTDPMLVRIYLQPAECTYPLGSQSPAEVGVWLGMQIIDRYMAADREKTIADLLRETDYRAILRSLNLKY